MDRLNQWLTFVANVGVLIGVFVVAYEVRQNTAVATAQAALQMNEALDASYRARAQDSVLAALVMNGHDRPDGLSDVERDQFHAWLRADMNAAEAAWFQYENGLIPEQDFDGYKAAICSRVITAGGRAYWEQEKQYFASRFRNGIDDWCPRDA